MDILTNYLKDIGSYKRLSFDEEKNLSRIMNSSEQSKEFEDKIDANRAREKLIESNYRLVVHVAKNYQNLGLPFMDIIQEGNLGLIHAVKKYDGTRGIRFSTFAVPIIKQKIMRALSNQSRLIRIPEYKLTQIRKLKNQILNLSEKEYFEITQLIDSKILSLDSLIINSSNQEKCLLDICKSNEKTPHEFYMDTHIIVLEECIEELSDIERKVVELRWGLKGGEKRTYLNIGKSLKISAKKAKQIDINSIIKMRNKHLTELESIFRK